MLQKEEEDVASVGMTRLDLSVEAKVLTKKQKTHDFGIMLQAGLLSVNVANKAGGYMRLERAKTLIDPAPPPQSLRVSIPALIPTMFWPMLMTFSTELALGLVHPVATPLRPTSKRGLPRQASKQ